MTLGLYLEITIPCSAAYSYLLNIYFNYILNDNHSIRRTILLITKYLHVRVMDFCKRNVKFGLITILTNLSTLNRKKDRKISTPKKNGHFHPEMTVLILVIAFSLKTGFVYINGKQMLAFNCKISPANIHF
ncbi:hypothetical protein COR50_07980 [Chitinophaga caeni]|uniref:Uncharacterized protein n=1 Tax=Chitinophaga caeni TaxID=2029983 RepID=A0A291QT27_9BACT|nr:hypothetical protein COR50_07980 [Chitinophaga caeni]